MIGLTTDEWSSRTVQSYFSLTIHYVTSNFILQEKTLNISPLSESHTGKTINKLLQKLIAFWKLDDMEIYFITDNGRNVVKAINLEPSWTRVACFAHTLQLVINDMFPKKNTSIGTSKDEDSEFKKLRKK